MTLNPIILADILKAHKEKVAAIIQKEAHGPEEHLKVYDKYQSLISRQADRDVEAFLEEQHTFDEYAEELKKYKEKADQIQYTEWRVLRLGMFEVHCDDLIRALTKRTENLVERLLNKIVDDHRSMNSG